MSAERLVTLLQIERAAVAGWPGLETEMVDGWLWRYASGGSVRANSVAALDYSGRDFDGSVARIEALYRARGATACFTISEVSRPAGLDEALAQRGYARGDDHVTLAKRITASPEPHAPALGVETADRPSTGWLAAYLSGLSANRREIAPRILAGLPRAAVYVSAVRSGVVIASGMTIPDGRLASIQCMATLPEARRQGAALAVLAEIERLATAYGCDTLYLQTDRDNPAAVTLYERFGCTLAGHYHTRRRQL